MAGQDVRWASTSARKMGKGEIMINDYWMEMDRLLDRLKKHMKREELTANDIAIQLGLSRGEVVQAWLDGKNEPSKASLAEIHRLLEDSGGNEL